MRDYMDLAEDKANIYQKGMIILVILSFIGSLFISYSLSQEMIIESNEILGQSITYETNVTLLAIYMFVSIILNVILGFVLKFFIDMYKELVMQRYMNYELLKLFEKAKIE